MKKALQQYYIVLMAGLMLGIRWMQNHRGVKAGPAR
jgi:hypothetical protein